MTNPPPAHRAIRGRSVPILTLLLAVIVGVAAPHAAPAATVGTGAVEGVVLDPDGHPAEATVAAVPESSGSSEEETRAAAFAHTALGGRFRIGDLKPGAYGFTATVEGHAAAFVGSVRVGADSTVRDVRLQCPDSEMVLAGTITTGTGDPLPGAEFRAVRYSDFAGDVFYAHADSSGAFRIELPNAAYLLWAVAPGRDPMIRSRQSEESRTLQFALAPSYPAGPAPDSVVAWFRGTGIPIATVEPGHGFEDLRRLGDLVGDARVVALGEATHGTREFFQMKNRVLEYLVEKKGFTVFGIEASMPEAFAVNEYVLTGRGDPAAALAGLYFWTWDTQEVLDMIHWMRRYNADPAHPRKVKFYGFDMQRASRAARALTSYLRGVDRAEADSAEAAIAPLADPYLESRFGTLPAARQAEITSAVSGILERMDSRKTEYSRRTGADAWALARQHGRVVSQFLALARDPSVRDRAMAENIGWILDREGPDARMVVWAHNAHVSASPEEGQGMGVQLRKMLGGRLVVLGFAFDRGSFQAIEMSPPMRRLRDFTAGPAPVGSLDETLSRTGSAVAAFDLRHAPRDGPVADWLAARHITRSIGAGYSDSFPNAFFTRQLIPRNYDALLYVDRTTAARAIVPRSAAYPAAPDTVANYGFEAGPPGAVPPGWTGATGTAYPMYRVASSRDHPREGAQCAEIRALPESRVADWIGGVSKSLPATPYVGKQMRLRAAVRIGTQDPNCGAHLWIRAFRRERYGTTTDLMSAEAAGGLIRASSWRDFEVMGVVPKEATDLQIGLSLVGYGTAWLDAVSLEPVGDATPRAGSADAR